jgi:hypothetical protein
MGRASVDPNFSKTGDGNRRRVMDGFFYIAQNILFKIGDFYFKNVASKKHNKTA